MKIIQLGAPSLIGRGANETVASTFVAREFPQKLRFNNLVAHALNFPEIRGLHLEPCTDSKGRSVEVEIPSLDAFQRLASSIEQVATLFKHKYMLEISTLADEISEEDDETGGDGEKTQESASQVAKKPSLQRSNGKKGGRK
jgi:hypothetical protein